MQTATKKRVRAEEAEDCGSSRKKERLETNRRGSIIQVSDQDQCPSEVDKDVEMANTTDAELEAKINSLWTEYVAVGGFGHGTYHNKTQFQYICRTVASGDPECMETAIKAADLRAAAVEEEVFGDWEEDAMDVDAYVEDGQYGVSLLGSFR